VDLLVLLSHPWLVGLLIGVAAAAPIGPVNILVIQRCLRYGRRSALWLGLGAACGDALFAAAAAFGLGAIKLLFHLHQDALRLGGGLFMLLFGVLLWRQSPHLSAPSVQQKPPRVTSMAVAVLVMTLTNPATLLWFVAAFAMAHFAQGVPGDRAAFLAALGLVLSVFLGSMLWWLALVSAAARLRNRITDKHLLWMNHICAALLATFGFYAIVTAY
jgi:putative LysE/RhtB family amino acid efflux pump